MTPPYEQKDSDGTTHYYAVCPMCDNPTIIKGMYKDLDGDKKFPIGSHFVNSKAGIGIPDQEAFDYCPYKSTYNKTKSYIYKRGNKVVEDIMKILREHYDRVLLVLFEGTGIRPTLKQAEDFLRTYIGNEGWTFRDTRPNNLPWIVGQAEGSNSLFGCMISLDSELYAVLQEYPWISFESYMKPSGESTHAIITRSGKYAQFRYFFRDHHFEYDATTDEMHEYNTFSVTYNGEYIYEKIIEADVNHFVNLCTTTKPTYRNTKILDIAKRYIR